MPQGGVGRQATPTPGGGGGCLGAVLKRRAVALASRWLAARVPAQQARCEVPCRNPRPCKPRVQHLPELAARAKEAKGIGKSGMRSLGQGGP